MHYASLTDMAWTADGKLLVVSSTDGYCSFIKFEEGMGECIYSKSFNSWKEIICLLTN